MPAARSASMFDAPEPPYRPALAHARPAAAAGGYQGAGQYGTQREIPFTDGAWRAVTVLAKMRDQGGGWQVLVRWFGGGSTHEDWLMYDRVRFREPAAQ